MTGDLLQDHHIYHILMRASSSAPLNLHLTRPQQTYISLRNLELRFSPALGATIIQSKSILCITTQPMIRLVSPLGTRHHPRR